jgi:hypothetical protein
MHSYVTVCSRDSVLHGWCVPWLVRRVHTVPIMFVVTVTSYMPILLSVAYSAFERIIILMTLRSQAAFFAWRQICGTPR